VQEAYRNRYRTSPWGSPAYRRNRRPAQSQSVHRHHPRWGPRQYRFTGQRCLSYRSAISDTKFRDPRISSLSRHPQRRHLTSRAAGLVDAVGGAGFVSAGAGAEVCFGSGPLDRAEGGAARGRGDGTRWTRPCSTMRSPPRDTITQLAECLRRADRYRPREFGIHESDGAPDEKERRPKQQPPGYQACVMRGEMWPRRQEAFPCLTQAHRAVPS
jgi:hypothetical protein